MGQKWRHCPAHQNGVQQHQTILDKPKYPGLGPGVGALKQENKSGILDIWEQKHVFYERQAHELYTVSGIPIEYSINN